MAMKRRHAPEGVTLIEILVTLVVASVIVGGLAALFTGAAADYSRVARLREQRFASQSLETELIWRLKAVPPEFLPDATRLSGQTITFTDETGSKTRNVLTYEYVRDDRRVDVANPVGVDIPIDGASCPVRVPTNPPSSPPAMRIVSGMIFQWFSVVYVVERDITATPANSFRQMAAGTLQATINGLFATPPIVPPQCTLPTPLALGVADLRFAIVEAPGCPAGGCGSPTLRDCLSRRRVTWTYSQYP